MWGGIKNQILREKVLTGGHMDVEQPVKGTETERRQEHGRTAHLTVVSAEGTGEARTTHGVSGTRKARTEF